MDILVEIWEGERGIKNGRGSIYSSKSGTYSAGFKSNNLEAQPTLLPPPR